MTTSGACGEPGDHALWGALHQLRAARFTDLTHAFEPGIPRAPSMPDESRRTLYDIDVDGFQAHLYEFAGQWGTHVDAPAHCCRGGRTVDAIAVTEMLLPLVIVDIQEAVAANPDFAIARAEIDDWESRNGRIPAGSFVALRSGWSERWPDDDAMHNKDAEGVRHFPGWSALRRRRVPGSGLLDHAIGRAASRPSGRDAIYDRSRRPAWAEEAIEEAVRRMRGSGPQDSARS